MQTSSAATTAVVVRPDGECVPTGGEDGVIRVRRFGNGEVMNMLVGHDHSIVEVAWSPGGEHLLSRDAGGVLRWWDVAVNRELRVFKDRQHKAIAMAWSPDGRLLAAACSGGLIALWDGHSGDWVRGFSQPAEQLAWSPDGTQLASCGSRGDGGDESSNVSVRDVESGHIFWSINARTPDDRCLAWSPDGGQLAIAKTDRGVLLCSATTGEKLQVMKDATGCRPVWSPAGESLAAMAERTLLITDVATGETGHRHAFSGSCREIRLEERSETDRKREMTMLLTSSLKGAIMRTIAFAGTLVILLSAGAFPTARAAPRSEPVPVNFVANPGFELVQQWKPVGWKIVKDKGFSLSDKAHTGQYCVALASPNDEWPSIEQEVKVLPRRTYLLSFWFRSEGDGGGKLSVQLIGEKWGALFEPRPTSEWQHCCYLITPTVPSFKLNLSNYHCKGMTFFIDDVSIDMNLSSLVELSAPPSEAPSLTNNSPTFQWRPSMDRKYLSFDLLLSQSMKFPQQRTLVFPDLLEEVEYTNRSPAWSRLARLA